jgi:hypothetical protein
MAERKEESAITDRERHRAELRYIKEVLRKGQQIVLENTPKDTKLTDGGIRLVKYVGGASQPQLDAILHCWTFVRPSGRGQPLNAFTISEPKDNYPLITIQFIANAGLAGTWQVLDSSRFDAAGKNKHGHIETNFHHGIYHSTLELTQRCKEILEVPGVWRVENLR